MAIETKTRKMLWGRAASRCAFPGCRTELFYDLSETDDPALIGEECHIVARKASFTRGNSPLSTEQRDKYNNLILLCRNHHKVVDSTDDPYSVDVLKAMKSTHEEWVRNSLAGYDASRQREGEIAAGYVERWELLADLDGWENWATGLMSHGHPGIPVRRLKKLEGLRDWMFRRIWPPSQRGLEAAFETFRRVLGDLINVLRDHGHQRDDEDGLWELEKRHKRIEGWDSQAYRALSLQFEFAVDLVQDLALELTRAANLVCDEVRRGLIPSYRLDQGLVVVSGGPYGDLRWRTYRVQYAAGTSPERAYPGLGRFMVDRESRDRHMGLGTSPEDYRARMAERGST